MPQNLFVTGTDTGVGKTVLSVLLIRVLLARGRDFVAVKPLCSGDREDAFELWAAQEHGRRNQVDGPVFSVDDLNPWSFAEPLTPMVAARRANVPLNREEILEYLEWIRRGRDGLLVEGAGGLLSPLADDADARDLISGLRATPLVVAANRLGALNQVLLTWEALPKSARAKARLVLMAPERDGLAERTNVEVLRERLGADRVHLVPRLSATVLGRLPSVKLPPKVLAAVETVVDAVGG